VELQAYFAEKQLFYPTLKKMILFLLKHYWTHWNPPGAPKL
jgi:hypothetical protein